LLLSVNPSCGGSGRAIDSYSGSVQVETALKSSSTVLVGCFGGDVWIKVRGKATLQVSSSLKKFVQTKLREGVERVLVDLEDCEAMDSTFMGTLAGIALQLRERGRKGLEVVRANHRNTALLQNLGLDQLFSVKSVGDPSAPELPGPVSLRNEAPPSLTGEGMKNTVLEAHEALVEADEENAFRFRDVLEVLRQENHSGDFRN